MFTHSSKKDSNKSQAVSVQQEKAITLTPDSSQGVLDSPGLLLSPKNILQLQSTIGNRAVIQLLKSQFQKKQRGQENVIQRTEIPEEESINSDPAAGLRENNTGLPDNLKAGVESLSGLPVDDVKVHYNSSRPAEIGALAYTLGRDIYVAPGQEKHLPHEAWHVVQQSQGRVKPTFQMKGLGVNNDAGLEREADEMGRKGESIDKKNRSQLSKVLAGGESRNKSIQMASGSDDDWERLLLEDDEKSPSVSKSSTESDLQTSQQSSKEPSISEVVDILVSKGVKKATKNDIKKYTKLKNPSVSQIEQINTALDECWKKLKSEKPTNSEKLKEINERLGIISRQEKEKEGIKPKQKRYQVLHLNRALNYKPVEFSGLSDEVKNVIRLGHKGSDWEKHITDPETGKEGAGIAEYKPFGTNSKIRLVSSADGKWYYCDDHNIYGHYSYHRVNNIQ